MCYRSPRDSNEFFTLTICPWNAIDMLHNPNVKPDPVSVLQRCWLGGELDLPWAKLEEYGYQFFLDGEVLLPANDDKLNGYMRFFQRQAWQSSEAKPCALVEESRATDTYIQWQATDKGRALLDAIFDDYQRIFMD